MSRKILANVCGALALVVAVAAQAKELRMVAPIIPPHFDDQGAGRIGDVIKATLARCHYEVQYTMVPFGRHWQEYKDSASFDGLATAEADQAFPGFSTRPFMHLQDGATVMARRGLQGIKSVNELGGRNVVAFPNARQILGIEGEVANFASYGERSNRYDQIRPLFADRVDAILADGLITAHFIGVLTDSARAGSEPEIDPSLQFVFRKDISGGAATPVFSGSDCRQQFRPLLQGASKRGRRCKACASLPRSLPLYRRRPISRLLSASGSD